MTARIATRINTMKDSADDPGFKANNVYVVFDENGDLASKYNIMSIPAIKIFKGGKEVNSAVGVQSREKLLEMISGRFFPAGR